jgi:hypothetical protein
MRRQGGQHVGGVERFAGGDRADRVVAAEEPDDPLDHDGRGDGVDVAAGGGEPARGVAAAYGDVDDEPLRRPWSGPPKARTSRQRAKPAIGHTAPCIS